MKFKGTQDSRKDLKKVFEKFSHEILDGYKQILLELLDERLEKENQPQPNLPNKVANAYRMGVNDGCITGLNEAKKLIQGTKI